MNVHDQKVIQKMIEHTDHILSLYKRRSFTQGIFVK